MLYNTYNAKMESKNPPARICTRMPRIGIRCIHLGSRWPPIFQAGRADTPSSGCWNRTIACGQLDPEHFTRGGGVAIGYASTTRAENVLYKLSRKFCEARCLFILFQGGTRRKCDAACILGVNVRFTTDTGEHCIHPSITRMHLLGTTTVCEMNIGGHSAKPDRASRPECNHHR